MDIGFVYLSDKAKVPKLSHVGIAGLANLCNSDDIGVNFAYTEGENGFKSKLDEPPV